ncbi:MAG: holo-ACP synthase [Deltaproteobacteria bacterium]|nr:holo-ACP synthase [Deltaproteobacteria bacterium]
MNQVVGIGVDIVEVERLARSLERTREFAAKVFTERERAYCEARAHPAEHFAARFAAKEAFLKAVGHGILEGIPLLAIEVVREGDGAPELRLGPAAARALKEAGATRALVTLSHAGGNAVAFVVVQ